MSYLLFQVFSLSIGIAATIGLIRIRKISNTFSPFIVLMCIGFLNELISWLVVAKGYSNAINANIYYLVDAVLLLLFFKKNGLFENNRKAFYWLLCGFGFFWIAELFFFRSIHTFSSYFIALYAFFIVIMSIHMINKLVAKQDGGATFRKPLFMICIGLILFYTCTVIIEIFWVYGLNSSKEFRLQVYRILAYINLAVNLMYAVALLWIPRKRESLLL